MATMDPYCEDRSDPSIVNFVFSILILFGILLSYLPQHYRIIARRSSFGISPYFILLGTTSGTAGFINILLLPRSGRDIACCNEVNGFACLAGLLGIFQVGAQGACFIIFLILFVIYFPRTSLIPHASSSVELPSFRVALTVAAVCIIHAIATVTLGLTVALAYPSYRQGWANSLGIMAAILASIQYFPQIYTTFRLRRVGSLSIPMMCIQTPGSLVWVGSLAARLGPEGWSSWGVYLVTALLQGTLLAMGVYFEYIDPQKAIDPDVSEPVEAPNDVDHTQAPAADNQDPASEETPLLQRKD